MTLGCGGGGGAARGWRERRPKTQLGFPSPLHEARGLCAVRVRDAVRRPSGGGVTTYIQLARAGAAVAVRGDGPPDALLGRRASQTAFGPTVGGVGRGVGGEASAGADRELEAAGRGGRRGVGRGGVDIVLDRRGLQLVDEAWQRGVGAWRGGGVAACMAARRRDGRRRRGSKRRRRGWERRRAGGARMSGASHASSSSERTRLTCVPILRWQPAHRGRAARRGSDDAHSGLAAPQSAHTAPLACSARIASPSVERGAAPRALLRHLVGAAKRLGDRGLDRGGPALHRTFGEGEGQ